MGAAGYGQLRVRPEGNRAEPGRVDLAVEVPHPDGDGRRRLLDLYGRNLKLTGDEADEIVAATASLSRSWPDGRNFWRQRRARRARERHMPGQHWPN